MAGFFDDQIVPIPDCESFINDFGKERGWDTPAKVASMVLDSARTWKRRHPGKDVLEILSPDWREYVKANI